MSHTRVLFACLLALGVLCGPAAAQVVIQSGPGGDPMQFPQPGRQMKTGTARIKGRIVTPETGAPVRRAMVRVSGPDIMPKAAVTDNDGRYEVTDLPAGRYTLSATKSGYMSVNYGQTRPFESGKPIELIEGQVVDKADITMPRGAAIVGRIIDEFGEPVADASVSAMRSTWANGRRRLQSAGRTATTNDLGQYRIFGLPPGEYYVSATFRGGQETALADMTMAVSIAGGAPADAPKSGYAPTYYPGTPNGGDAQKIALTIGQEAPNTDFGLSPVRLAKVTGSVLSSEGRPAEGVMVTARPRNASGAGAFTPLGSGRTDKNGSFTLNGIPPGEYTLTARAGEQVFATTEGDRMMVTMTRTTTVGAGNSPGDVQPETGSVPLSVTGDDVSNVIVTTSRGATVSGRVVYEGGSKPPAGALRVSAASPDADGPLGMLGGLAPVSAEGTFEIRNISGPRYFGVMNMPPGWMLKAIRLNGADITDSGTDVRGSEPVTGVEVVLTSKTTEVTGAVTAGNEPATDYTVVIFPDDPQKWTLPSTRHIATARPSQSGQFQVKNLPAGSYYAVALEYIPQGDWFDPDVLERLRAKATRLSLDEGETARLDLKIVTP